jgi:hypothetical protein
MYGASNTYMIGSFDGKTFKPESGKHYYVPEQYTLRKPSPICPKQITEGYRLAGEG